MKKNEAQFQTYLNSWLKNVFIQTCAYETKYTSTESINFKRLEEHQKQALLTAKHSVLNHKIADAGFTNPFDGFMLVNVPAYVIVKYKNHNEFVLIDIDDWIKEEEKSPTRSLYYERAREIATHISYKLCLHCGKKMPMHKHHFCSDKCQREKNA